MGRRRGPEEEVTVRPPFFPAPPVSTPPAIRHFGTELFLIGLCGVAWTVFASIAPGFAAPASLGNVVISCLPLLVLAVGQTLVLVTGGIDLSAPSIIGVCSVTGALLMDTRQGWLAGSAIATPTGIAIMLAAGALVGFLNGACIGWLRMPAFMVTLTSAMFFNGFAVWLARAGAGADTIYNLPPVFVALGGQAVPALLLGAGTAVAAHLFLGRTVGGRWLQAVGHNPRAALISGVPVTAVTLGAHVLSGACAAVAAILLTARLETGSPSHGRSLLLDVIGAVVIGGTSLFGGRGRVSWTVLGVLFFALLGNGLNLLNCSDFAITITKGCVILAAALLDVARRRRPA